MTVTKQICPCVLIYRCPVQQTWLPVPLKDIRYDVEIRGPIAELRLTQTYRNTTGKVIDVVYEFPRTDSSCFTKFEAVFRNRTVEGVIKPKEVAKQEFA